MPDTATQIRNYYEEITIRVTADEILEPAVPITPLAPRRFPPALVAGVTAAVVILILGSLGLWLASSRSDIEPATSSTSLPPLDPPLIENALPDVSLAQVPSFEAVVRYQLGDTDGTGEEGTVDVLFSYEPPDSYRREILALDPPDTDFHWGKVGDLVASDGNFRIVTGETTEEGQVLGPLVWFNWEHRCGVAPVPVQTETNGRTLTTVTCEDPGDPWTIVVDRDSGVVIQASGALPFDDFSIAGIGLEIVNMTYEPSFAAAWFETPEPEPPAIPGDPMVFTYTETENGRTTVVQVTWQDEATWRSDVISGNFGSLGSGSYQIFADQTLFTYSAGTNEYLEERFPVMEGRRSLPALDCSEDGTCIRDDLEIVCITTPDGRIAGRPVTRYDCAWPPPYSPSTSWIDDELGYTLKDGDGLEVLEIDLNPVIDPAIFNQVCPAADCTPVDTS